MFCPNCGMKNDEDALFCESCGTRLTDEQQPEPAQVQTELVQAESVQPSEYYTAPAEYQTPAPMEKNKVILVVEVILAVAAIALFICTGKNIFSVDHVAGNYFKTLMDADWDKVYDFLDVTETEFINKDAFVAAQEGNEAQNYNTYNVKSDTSSGILADVVITYGTKEGERTEYVTLNKQKQKKFFMFDSWKVNAIDYVCKNITVDVPDGVEIHLDGKKISSEYLEDSEDGNQEYIIPAVFFGEHEVEFAIDGLDKVTEHVYVDEDDYYISCNAWSISEDEQKKIVNELYLDIQKIYKAEIAGEDYSNVSSLFSTRAREDAEFGYTNLSDQLSGGEVSKIQFNNISADSMGAYIEGGRVYSSVHVSYEYSVNYMSYDYWDGRFYPETASDSGEAYCTMEYEDGKWLLADFSVPSIYFDSY